MKAIAASCFVVCANLAFATTRPVLSDVTVRSGGNTVTVSYTVDRPAVVTFAAFTNGMPLAESWTAIGVNGDVFRRVAAGTHTFIWKARRKDDAGFIVHPANLRVKAWAVDNPPDYAVFDLTDACSARYYETVGQLPGGITNLVYKTKKLVMRKIPAANETFRMGTTSGSVGRQSNEVESHVTFTNDFYLGVYELTEGQYAYFQGKASNSTYPFRSSYTTLRGGSSATQWPGDGHTVDATASVIYMARVLANNGLLFDLPTHAQWEFACRAGTESSLYTGVELTVSSGAADPALEDIAWYGYNSGTTTSDVTYHAVGLKQPNAWGLYDMLGNVWEWVLDWDETAAGGTRVDPVGPASGSKRKRCGGGYDSQPYCCRAACEESNTPSYSNHWISGVNGKCNPNQGTRLWLPAVAER